MNINLEKDLCDYLNQKINNINIDELFENVKLNSLINIVLLTELCEALYFRELIVNKEQNNKLLGFLDLLRSANADSISEMTFLYIIYCCERELKKSQNNIYI